ncbi:MAG: hypothetical protein HQL65_17475 [Magnetococcales bacterium]|nr:hypothetical protein [Magnetococcales bacterium]
MSISTIANYWNGRSQKPVNKQNKERHDDFFTKATTRGIKEEAPSRTQESPPPHKRMSDAYRVTISPAALAKMDLAALA